MPTRLSKPELLHLIALKAAKARVNVKRCIANAFAQEGLRNRDVSTEAERLLRPVQEAIDDHLQTYSIRGLRTFYQRDGSSPAYAVPTPDCGVFRWTAGTQKILMDLDSREFELLLGNIFVQREFSDVAVTPPSGDGGFDYVCKVRPRGINPTPPAVSGPSIIGNVNWYFFGQAKRYSLSNPVQLSSITSLLGSIELLDNRNGTPTIDRMRQKLEDWGWRLHSPVTPSFATSGRYTSEIPGLARRRQWCIFDGEQVAQRVLALGTSFNTIRDVRAHVRTLAQTARPGVTTM